MVWRCSYCNQRTLQNRKLVHVENQWCKTIGFQQKKDVTFIDFNWLTKVPSRSSVLRRVCGCTRVCIWTFAFISIQIHLIISLLFRYIDTDLENNGHRLNIIFLRFYSEPCTSKIVGILYFSISLVI